MGVAGGLNLRDGARGVALTGLLTVVAGGYGAVIVLTEGQPLLAIAPVALLLCAAVFARPIVGVYAAVAAALLFEQWGIVGLDSLTAQSHFFDNISGFTSIDLRFSAADLLIAVTLVAWLVTASRPGAPHFRPGPVGYAVAAFLICFAGGMLVGLTRGGAWNQAAALAELRGPVYLTALYFLSANLLRTRRDVVRLLVLMVSLLGVKALQAVWNGAVMFGAGERLEAVTSHEDVVFFDAVLALAFASALLLGRSRITYGLAALVPPILVAELLTQRRVAFVALAAALLVVTVCVAAVRTRRTLVVVAAGSVLVAAYLGVFWNQQSGVLGQPVRAVKGIIAPDTISERDRLSNLWRDIENANISFTLREVPLTGVGLGQQYFFQREPPELTGFAYWRYMTHNAVAWVWLKAGLLGFAVLWWIVIQTVAVGARLVRQLEEPSGKLIACLPIALVVAQVVYSSVDLGLTFSRPMIVLGVSLGILAPLASWAVIPHRSGVPVTRFHRAPHDFVTAQPPARSRSMRPARGMHAGPLGYRP